jgi:hypothetical protein
MSLAKRLIGVEGGMTLMRSIQRFDDDEFHVLNTARHIAVGRVSQRAHVRTGTTALRRFRVCPTPRETQSGNGSGPMNVAASTVSGIRRGVGFKYNRPRQAAKRAYDPQAQAKMVAITEVLCAPLVGNHASTRMKAISTCFRP